MSFPSTGLLDGFDRADADPIDGNWTVAAGNPTVASNRVSQTTTNATAYWSTGMASGDVEAWMTIAVQPAAGFGDQVGLRARRNPGVHSGYALRAIFGSPQFITIDNTLGAEISAVTPGTTMVSGDKIGLRCVGSTIQSWHCPVSTGVWVRIAEVTDANEDGTGSANKLAFNLGSDSAARGDDFGGGVYAPLSFPSTGILDDFDRANEGPQMAGWGAYLSDGLKIVSNECAPNDAGDNGAHWLTSQPRPDVEAYATLTTSFPSDAGILVHARGDPSTLNSYNVQYEAPGGSHQVCLKREAGGAGTHLGASPWAQALSAGDAIGIRVIGSTVEAWVRLSGVWSMLGDAADTTYPGASPNNKLMMYIGGSTALRMDDFGGGVVWPGEAAAAAEETLAAVRGRRW